MGVNGKIVAALVAVVMIIGTGVYYFGSHNTRADSEGTLGIYISDTALAGWSAVYINLTSVSVLNSTAVSSGGYTKSLPSPDTVNVDNATVNPLFLTSLNLPAGSYKMIRIVITGAYGLWNGVDRPQYFAFTLVNGTVGIAGQISISGKMTTNVTLAFSSPESISGNTSSGFLMSPVLSMTVS